eukprot:32028-Amphidinium_carterae.1
MLLPHFNNLKRMQIAHGSWSMKDVDDIGVEKQYHELWKKSGGCECMKEQDFKEVSYYLYSHELVGRANWDAKKT